ncbi:hypothetical protein FRC11_015073 [Ceratobasidium sp. 423]|nr:hypothetical protein FRC11_015073 [Ceratobasidium sp. 423]
MRHIGGAKDDEDDKDADKDQDKDWDEDWDEDKDEDEDEDMDDCQDNELAGIDLLKDEDFDFEDDGMAPLHTLDPDPEEGDGGNEDNNFDENFLLPNMLHGSEEEKEFCKVKDGLKKVLPVPKTTHISIVTN